MRNISLVPKNCMLHDFCMSFSPVLLETENYNTLLVDGRKRKRCQNRARHPQKPTLRVFRVKNCHVSKCSFESWVYSNLERICWETIVRIVLSTLENPMLHVFRVKNAHVSPFPLKSWNYSNLERVCWKIIVRIVLSAPKNPMLHVFRVKICPLTRFPRRFSSRGSSIYRSRVPDCQGVPGPAQHSTEI